MFPKFILRQLPLETKYELDKNKGFKIWLTKHGRRPVAAKRKVRTKKVLYAVFFSCVGIAIQVTVPKGKSVAG